MTRFLSRKSQSQKPPRLLNPIRYPFGEFEVQIQGAPGQSVDLQITRDFKSWETLETITLPKETSTLSDKKAGNYSALFYRAVSGAFTSNIVGFLSADVPPGYSMISNPLHSASNQIAALIPAPPEETAINKFNLVTFSLNKNVFQHKKWQSPTEMLAPGDGALILNPSDTPFTVRFVGEVPGEEQSIHIHSGTSMRGSLLPMAGRLDTDLRFPMGVGDVISLYSNHNEKYLEFKFTDNGWAGEPPFLRLGEAFWVAKNSATVWKQKLPAPPPPKES